MQLNMTVAKKPKCGETINMIISEEGISLVKKFEGCKLEAYQCAAGVWTCGWGSTRGVKEGDVWSQEKADIMLIDELHEYGNYVNDMVTMPLHQNQFDSLTSWCFNLGPTNLSESSLLRVLNEGSYEEVPYQIKRWNKVNGKINEGLIRRREAEALLFEGKDWTGV